MLNFAEKIAPSGALTYGARGSGKDDRVALGLVAAMAEAKGMLRGSPYAKNRRRTEYGPSDEAA